MIRRAAALALSLALIGWAFPVRAQRAVVEWEYGYVNVRAGPGTETEQVGRLSEGAEAQVVEEQGEWARVRYPGGEGWVVSRSLKTLPPEPESAPVPTQPVPESGAVAQSPPAPEGGTPPGPPPPASGEAEPEDGGYLARYDEGPSSPGFGDPASGFLRMLSGLFLVLALFAGAVYLFRRFSGRGLLAGRGAAGIRVLASQPLGQRQGLLLVEAGGQVWLLGQGPEGVNLISEIRDPQVVERLNDRFGFLETPFESELRRQVDLESRDAAGTHSPETAAGSVREPSPEERLEALRRRPKPDGGPP